MGQGVVDLVKNVNLNCKPVDKNRNSKLSDDIVVTLAGGITAPSYTVNGLVMTFSSSLPAGTHTLDYWCYK